ncbi:hypothetical protein ILUMI_21657 [Ignelater luminosus]|uniref:Uncharacterized protein n=1 Tax=Ignelater luminosus TaxID=2038154 RepID=A0A8K0CIB9_IGNLU|nr:hypothetical protein ILUMI_21657 [Ignelater luminosus]
MSFSSQTGRKTPPSSNYTRLPVPRTPPCNCRPKRSESKTSKSSITPKISLVEASTTASDVAKETGNTSGSVLQILPPSYGTSSCSQELVCTSTFGPFQPADKESEKKTEVTDKPKYSLSQSSVPRRTGQCNASCSTCFDSPHGKLSLGKLVEEELKLVISKSPENLPRVKSSKVKCVSPPVLMTTEGSEPATHQLTLDRSVRRLPDKEIINRQITGIKVDQCGCAHQTEVNIQSIEPSGRKEAPLNELITTSSSLTVGAGGKSKTTTTIYESLKKINKDEQEIYRSKIKTVDVCDRAKIDSTKMKNRDKLTPEERSHLKVPPTKMTEPGRIDSTEIIRLIEEETRDIDTMKGLQTPRLKGSTTDCYGLKKKIDKIRLAEEASRLESSVVSMPATADEHKEEVQPEVVAALMHTEERGLDMEAPPSNVYNYLFPDSKNELVIKISSVAPAPLQNVVVPVDVPPDLHAAGVTPEIQNIVKYTNSHMLPVDNIYEKSVLKTDKAVPKLNNTVLKGKRTSRFKCKSSKSRAEICNTSPPWKDEDLEPMINLVGASPSTAFPIDEISEAELSTVVHNRLDNSLEYNLIPQAPRHISRVQLRGTQNPSWFPGYYIALPDSIRVVKSPSEVLPAAWQAVQPDIFSEDSFLVVR